MTYTLAIGDRHYSSWSLRGWLLFEKFDLPVKVKTAHLYTDAFPAMLQDFAPARMVPVMKTPKGVVVQDTLAMAETLAERHPKAQMWPKDAKARMMARSIVAEMHSGFTALRSACAMNLRRAYVGFTPDDFVRADIARIEQLWHMARGAFGQTGPWLLGEYSIADAFFAPVAARIVTFDLPIANASAAYVDAHLNDGAFRRWRAMGFAQNYIQQTYEFDLPERAWPGAAPLAAKAVKSGPSENATCPYSGLPSVDYLQIDGRTFGFCNPFCRDKTLADPLAWPDFVNIYEN